MQTRVFLLLAAMAALFGAVGYLIAGPGGMMTALLFAGAMNVFAWWTSGSLVLSMYHARLVERAESPGLYDLVAQLARQANLPMPKLYVIHEDQPNAFATGRNPENGAVAVTTGLMNLLSREELAGVIAHELAHIRNRDTLMMTITATLAGAIGMLGNMLMLSNLSSNRQNNNSLGPIAGLLVMILAPLAATLVQMAISRTREYQADQAGAEICGNPHWLAAALEKIDAYAQGTFNVTAERNPATAHLFIANPLSGRGADSLFSTHPATGNRIARLMELARQGFVAGTSRQGFVAGTGGYQRPAAGQPPRRMPKNQGPWG
jgi:heat shock protein HtpX